MNGVRYSNQIQLTNGSLTIQNGAVEADQEAIKQSNLTTCTITHPHPHDVLCGRGNTINYHPGNQYFRSLVKPLKPEYVESCLPEKKLIAQLIVEHIHALRPPGRFLKKNKGGNFWEEVENKYALEKTRQSLREDAKIFKSMIEKGQLKVMTNVRTSKTLESMTSSMTSSTSAPAPVSPSPSLMEQTVCNSSSCQMDDRAYIPLKMPPLEVSFDTDNALVTDSLDSADSWGDQGIEDDEGPHMQINTNLQKQDRFLLGPKHKQNHKALKLPDTNALMNESFKSVSIASIDMMSMDTSRHAAQVNLNSEEDNGTVDMTNSFVNTFDTSFRFLAENKTDSTDKLIHDTFMSSFCSFDPYNPIET